MQPFWSNQQLDAGDSMSSSELGAPPADAQARSVMPDDGQLYLAGTAMPPNSSTITTTTGFSDNETTTIQSVNYSIDNSDLVNVTREYPVDYATVMFGYIMPFVLLLTIVTNTLVVMVLAQRHMRTPTNIVLFTMAIVDLMTLLSPSPWYFYIYTLGYPDKFLYPPLACYTHHIMTDVIPVFFHTSSIWLALLLASQRYIYVCHPTLARTWFFDNTFTTVEVVYENTSRRDLACKNAVADWVNQIDIAIYYQTYFTFRILFVFVIPCVALITLNYLLFRALRRAENKRTELLRTKFKLVSGKHHHHHHPNDNTSNINYLHSKNHSVIGTYELGKEQSSYGVFNNSQTNLNSNNPNSVNENASSTDNNEEDERNNHLRHQLPGGASIELDTLDEKLQREGHPRTRQTTSEKASSTVKDDKSKRAFSRDTDDDHHLLHCAHGQDEGEVDDDDDDEEEEDDDDDDDDDDSTCPECAAYNRATGNEDECHRCFRGAEDNAQICDRNGHSQHRLVSQCSSLLGGATNNTLTIEDLSSCLATQNASMFASRDNADGDNDNDRDDDAESTRVDDIDRDEAESRSQSRSSGSSSSSTSSDSASNSSLDKRGASKELKDGRTSSVDANEDSKTQQFTKSGSVDSRLVCGCLSARAKVKRRLRLLSSKSCDSRRACRGKYCRSAGCQRDKLQARNSNEQSSGEVATTTTNLAPNSTATTTTKHNDRLVEHSESNATCNNSDLLINKRQRAADEGSTFKRADRHSKLPSSKSDNFGQTTSKRVACDESQRSRQRPRAIPVNGGSVDRTRRANRNLANGDTIHEQQTKLFGGGGSQSKIGTAAATTTTTTATTTTTLYSVNTNNSTNSLSQVQQQQHAPAKQQLEMPVAAGVADNSSLKMNYHGLSRMKSPSFASCTTGRGSRTTLLGSNYGAGHGCANSMAAPSSSAAIPLIVSTNFATTQPASSSSVRTMDSNRTTLMLIVVVTVFLMVEVPVAIVTILHVVLNTFEAFRDVELSNTLNYIKLFTNFFIMISYSVNFTIYCSMSKKFRETFRDLVLCGSQARRRKLRAHRSSYQNQNSQYATTVYNHQRDHHSQAAQLTLTNQQTTTIPITMTSESNNNNSSTVRNYNSNGRGINCLSTVQNDFNTTTLSSGLNVNANTNSDSTSGGAFAGNAFGCNLKTTSNNHLLAANLMRLSSNGHSSSNQFQRANQRRQLECEL